MKEEGYRRDDGKECWEKVYQTCTAWMACLEVDTSNPRVVHLLEELPEVNPSLMVDKGFGNKSSAVSSFYES